MPTKLQGEIIAEQYKMLIYKHQEQRKTLKKISQHYYFPHMRKLVEEHLQKYIY